MSEDMTIDELHSRMGALDPSLADAAAVWVGTDAARDQVQVWGREQGAWKERTLALLASLDCEPVGARFRGNVLYGFVPRDPGNLAPGLIPDSAEAGVFIADAASEDGQRITEEVSAINAEFRTLYDYIGGLHGAEHLSDDNPPCAVVGTGTHPVLYLAEDEPQEVKGRITADFQLWTPVSPAQVRELLLRG